MEQDIQDVIADIITFLNGQNTWSKNEKIRYAYTELGKHIHKNVRFFYTLYNLMQEMGYTAEELKKVYDNELPTDNVICKDSAQMLKLIFDKIGIESEIRKYLEVDHYVFKDGEVDIQHYFTIVTGDDGKKYFLTLTPDLPNIQLGFKTDHFATNIVYINDNGVQVYEGEEIDNTVMSEEELKRIDEKIGYLSFKKEDSNIDYANASLLLLSTANQKYKDYLERMTFNLDNPFYKDMIKLFHSEEEESLLFKLENLTPEIVTEIKDYTVKSIKDKIESDGNIKYTHEEEIELYELIRDRDYQGTVNTLNKIMKERLDESISNDMFSPKALTTCTPKFFNVLDNLLRKDMSPEEKKKYSTNLMVYLFKLAKVYIPHELRPTQRGRNYTNTYIANKIKVLFPEIFDFGYSTDFVKMKSGEKGVIIQRILQIIFPELSKDEAKERIVENPIDNRIKISTIYDRFEERYQLLINIDALESKYGFENNEVLIYDYNKDRNCFVREDEDISIMDIMADKDRYIVFSRNKLMIEAENIINTSTTNRTIYV